ncbi:MAG: hypothetical protein KFH87_03710 [Bacteroidetes bacterium]|nr:hypothetical protein [Bacteroidota bacterium]
MKRVAFILIFPFFCLLIGLLFSRDRPARTSDLRVGIALEEPEHGALSRRSVVAISPRGTRFVIYNDRGDFIAVYDGATGALLHCYVLGDELPERIHPRKGEAAVKYEYGSSPGVDVYHLPFERGSMNVPHEIETARFLSEESIVFVVNVKGPWRVDRKQPLYGIGMTVALVFYNIDKAEITGLKLLRGMLDDYIPFTSAIDETGGRVAFCMVKEKGAQSPRPYHMMFHDIEADVRQEISDGSIGLVREEGQILPKLMLRICGEELLSCTDYKTLQSAQLRKGGGETTIVDPALMKTIGVESHSILYFNRIREGEYSLLAGVRIDEHHGKLMYYRFSNGERVKSIRINDLIDGDIICIAERPGADEIMVLYVRSNVFFVKQLML